MAPIDLSGISHETALGSQPKPLETAGVSKALAILDRAEKLKAAAAYNSPALSLKATRQVGTVTNVTSPTRGGSLGSKVSPFGAPTIKEPGIMTKKLKVAVALGGEEVARAKTIILNRASTRGQTDELFESAKENRLLNRKTIYQLFIQAAAAETMAPDLQKEASVQASSVTLHVDSFFSKTASDENLDEAQRRFPELLQVRR